jgi:threonine 3-dehydrogenase
VPPHGEAAGRFGGIDVLHNNVGIAIPGGPVELSEDDWDRVMRVNVKSMFLTCKHVLPQMERQGRGVIVNIASHNAVRSLPVFAIAYAASKAAVIAMTSGSRDAICRKGIRANTILPGLMDTPWLRPADRRLRRQPREMRMRRAQLPTEAGRCLGYRPCAVPNVERSTSQDDPDGGWRDYLSGAMGPASLAPRRPRRDEEPTRGNTRRPVVEIRDREGRRGAGNGDVPVPDPGPDEVLVRVRASAVCGTDLHIAQWNAWARNAGIRLPLVMGHEFCGEVVGIGSRVRALKSGDYVAGETHLPCGACYQCRNGLQHICGNLKLFGIHRDGCFAEYATIPEQCAYPVPVTIPPRIAAMLEPLGTSLRAVLEMDVSGGSVVVIGCGPIGLFAIASARALGASRIIGLDVREERLVLARKVGCGLMLDPLHTDVTARILEATDGVGADAIIEASGNAAALESAFRFLRKGGRCALIGLPSVPVRLNLGPDVIFKEATIVGIHDGRSHLTRMQAFVERTLNVDPIATHECPCRKPRGPALLERGEGARSFGPVTRATKPALTRLGVRW